MTNAIKKIIDLVFSCLEFICKLMVVFMTVVVSLQVLFRLFGSNISWCEEIMLFMLDVLMFFLIPIGIKEDLHIRVEAFAKFMPKKVRVVMVYVSDVVLLLVSLCMIWYGRLLMTTTYSKFTITGIPRSYLYLATVISGILCTIIVIAKLCGLYKTQSTIDFIEGTGESAKNITDGEAI